MMATVKVSQRRCCANQMRGLNLVLKAAGLTEDSQAGGYYNETRIRGECQPTMCWAGERQG